jgi:hypothetical protein
MATLTEMPNLNSTDRRELRNARNTGRCDTPPRGDVLMKQILEKMSSTPWDEVLRRIACSSHIRRGKVLHIRRQIAQGTYEIDDRVDGAADRVLEAIIA